MSDGSIGGWEPENPADLSLDGVPTNWDGWTRAARVQRLLDVVQEQLRKVRAGSFNPAKGERVAALALEGQLELTGFYADAEASAKNAKHTVEYTEGEIAAEHAKEAADKKVRVSEASLKRVASMSSEVKQARKDMVDLEREYKKWRYVFEILKEAHIFFRNIGKL
jgi:hypothetical protein